MTYVLATWIALFAYLAFLGILLYRNGYWFPVRKRRDDVDPDPIGPTTLWDQVYDWSEDDEELLRAWNGEEASSDV